jgi:hypothetical protein
MGKRILKIIGYVLSIIFGIDLAYIFSGIALARHSVSDVLWHLVWAAAMVALGVWLINRKPKSSRPDDEK